MAGGTCAVGEDAGDDLRAERGTDPAYQAQLYYDLRGSEAGEPVEPGAVLGYWLRQLGDSEEQVPADLREKAIRFRSRTYGMRLLIVLDDAHSAAQLRELLPSSPWSLVVVTSRRWFDGLGFDGFGEIVLNGFSEEVAEELLRRSIGPAVADPEAGAVRDLIAMCGGTPLVLRVASARISRWRRPAPVSAFVANLRSHEALAHLHLDGTPLMEPIYDLCYAELSPAQARAYWLLALHPGPDFSGEAAQLDSLVRLEDTENVVDPVQGGGIVRDQQNRPPRPHRGPFVGAHVPPPLTRLLCAPAYPAGPPRAAAGRQAAVTSSAAPVSGRRRTPWPRSPWSR